MTYNISYEGNNTFSAKVFDSLGHITWSTENPVTGDELVRLLVVEQNFHQRDVFESMSFAMRRTTINKDLRMNAERVVSCVSKSVSEDPKLGRVFDLLRKWIRHQE